MQFSSKSICTSILSRYFLCIHHQGQISSRGVLTSGILVEGGTSPKKISRGGVLGGVPNSENFLGIFLPEFFFCLIKIRFRALRARKFFFGDFLRGGVPSPWASPRGGVRTPPLDFSRGGVNPNFCSQRGGRPLSPPPMVMYDQQ